MIRLLFLGDVVGEPGRSAIRSGLPPLLREEQVDLVVVNGENAAGGQGLTPPIAEEFKSFGVDVVTSGNHIWKEKSIVPYLADHPWVLRPLNFPPGSPGSGTVLVRARGGVLVGVLNVIGRVGMPQQVDDPFRTALQEVERLRRETPVLLVDMHAEATSEKQAMGWYLDGKVSVVVGSHTHVPTADERILPGGTAFLTDAGMTGPYESVIGVKREQAIERFLTQMPRRLEVARRDARLSGLLVEVDASTGRATGVRRVHKPVGGEVA